MKKTTVKFAALALILCLGISLMAVACDNGAQLEETDTDATSETVDTGDAVDTGDTEPAETEDTTPTGITAKPELGDADMPTVGWDETAG